MDYAKEFDGYVLAYYNWLNTTSTITAQEIEEARKKKTKQSFYVGFTSIIKLFGKNRNLIDIIDDSPFINTLDSEVNSKNKKLSLDHKICIQHATDWYRLRHVLPTEDDWKKYPAQEIAQGLRFIINNYEIHKNIYIQLCKKQENL